MYRSGCQYRSIGKTRHDQEEDRQISQEPTKATDRSDENTAGFIESTREEVPREPSPSQEVSGTTRVFEAPVPEIGSNMLTAENAFSRVDPDQFSAAIVYYRSIDFDKALIVLANGIVFEASGRERSRFEVGDTIAAKQSQRAARRHYVLTGGDAGSVSSYRVRCESPRPSKQTRVRCNLANSILREREG